MFSKKMSLKDFALVVGTELEKQKINVVLTGGAVVSIYSDGKYVSNIVWLLFIIGMIAKV